MTVTTNNSSASGNNLLTETAYPNPGLLDPDFLWFIEAYRAADVRHALDDALELIELDRSRGQAAAGPLAELGSTAVDLVYALTIPIRLGVQDLNAAPAAVDALRRMYRLHLRIVAECPDATFSEWWRFESLLDASFTDAGRFARLMLLRGLYPPSEIVG